MKEFIDYLKEKNAESTDSSSDVKLFTEYFMQSQKDLEYLTESENAEVDKWVTVFEEEYDGDINNIDEGLLGRIVGGTAGFLVGPTIGKVIAKALGVEKGILFDMFTSRLVSAALGAAIAKSFEKK